MATIPKTSVALLRAIADSPDSNRWTDFYSRYQPMMSAYLRAAFPSLEEDDVIQDALVVFMEKVPFYKYEPDVKGLFRNYLIGILKFKAIEALKRRKREQDKRDGFRDESDDPVVAGRAEESAAEADDWRRAALHIAVRDLMADKSINLQTREIFRRVAIKGESPEVVAEAFGVERNNVDQIKARMMQKLRARIREKENVNG